MVKKSGLSNGIFSSILNLPWFISLDVLQAKTADISERKKLSLVLGSKMKTSEMLKLLYKAFKVRARDAWKLVKNGKVRKYVFKPSGRVRWTVLGEHNEYLIYEAVEYCSCEDFFQKFNIGYICKHIIAQKLAETKRIYETTEKKDTEFDEFMSRWKPPHWKEL